MRYGKLSGWCFVLGCLAVQALPLLVQPALAQPSRQAQGAPAPAGAVDREITVINHSKRSVNELYVSPSNADQWGDDRLGDDTLDPGKSLRIRLGKTRDCEFDIQVVYDDASHEESRNVNVCRIRQATFDGSNATAAPPATAGTEHKLTLTNNSARPIQQVFISPADASAWGDDRLADDSISVGDDKELSYGGDCVADLRIVFDNKSAEERRGLNICDTAAISIEPGWTTADAVPTGQAPAGTVPPRPAPLPSPMPPPTAPSRPFVFAQPPATPRPPPPAPPGNASPGNAASGTFTPGTVAIVNQSGHDVVEFYLYPAGSSDRGQDRLGANELKAGGTLNLRFDRGSACKFTAHIVYGGSTADGEVPNVDLCTTPQIVLRP